MTLTPTRIRTDACVLLYVPGPRMFVAEASDLQGNGLHPGRVYDDACDVGYTLVSHRTGTELVMVQHHSERDAEGELLWDEYVPARELATIVRGAAPTCTLRVYND